MTTLTDELKNLLPALEEGRAIHLDWRDWLATHPERLVHEPGLGDVPHHQKQIHIYDERIRLINAAVAAIEDKGSGEFI